MDVDSAIRRTPPLQLIEEHGGYESEKCLRLVEKNFTSLLGSIGDRRLFVVSVNGPKDSGKSLLVSYLCKYLEALECGDLDWFGWDAPDTPSPNFFGDEKTPNYSGIWAHNHVFNINFGSLDKGMDIAVVILYTQCPELNDWKAEPESTVFPIIGLSMLISSHAIFNFRKSLNEKAISGVCQSIRYAMFKQLSTLQNVKNILPDISFLIQEWNYPTDYSYGVPGGTDYVVHQKLQPQLTHTKTSWQNRKIIFSSFKNIRGCLLPFPGYSTFQRDFNRSNSQLEPLYLDCLYDFYGYVVDLQKIFLNTAVRVFCKNEWVDKISNFMSAFTRGEMQESGINQLLHLLEVKNALLKTDAREIFDAVLNEFSTCFDKFISKSPTECSQYFDESTVENNYERAIKKAQKVLRERITKACSNLPNSTQEESNLKDYWNQLEKKFQAKLQNRKLENKKCQKAYLALESSKLIEEYTQTIARFVGSSSHHLGSESHRRRSNGIQSALLEKFKNILGKPESDYDPDEATAYKSFQKSLAEASGALYESSFGTIVTTRSTNNLSGTFGDLPHNIPHDTIHFRDEETSNTVSPSSSLATQDTNTGSLSLNDFGDQADRSSTDNKVTEIISALVEQHQSSLSSELGGNISEIKFRHSELATDTINSFVRTISRLANPSCVEGYKDNLQEKLDEVFEIIRQKKNQEQRKIADDFLERAKSSYAAQLKDYVMTTNEVTTESLLSFETQLRQTFLESLAQNHFCNQDELQASLSKIFDSISTEHQDLLLEMAEECQKTIEICKDRYHEAMHEALTGPGLKTENLDYVHQSTMSKVLKDVVTDSSSIKYSEVGKRQIPEIRRILGSEYISLKSTFEHTLQTRSYQKSHFCEQITKFYKSEIRNLLKDVPNPNVSALEQEHQHVISSTKTKFMNEPFYDDDLVTIILQEAYETIKQENQINQNQEPAIGIDLGTTFSCVSVYWKGKLTVIPNSLGEQTTPSYVYFDTENDKFIVGSMAKERAYENPEATIFDAKRLIGRKFSDKDVQKDVELWPFKVVNDGKDVPVIQVNGDEYPPEYISAQILAQLKQDAETYLGMPVKKAVITVPAYFTDSQREATIAAGEIAGLEVLSILNEPVAAALAYKIQILFGANADKDRNILIFDLGGGTFDVAVASTSRNKINVLAVEGDSHLGGEDFDRSMMEYCVQQFKREHGIDLKDGMNSSDKYIAANAARRIKRLQKQCEAHKIILSGSATTEIVVDDIVQGFDLRVSISRSTFEQINKQSFARTEKVVRKAIKDAKLKTTAISDIILIGGSTRIPKIQQMLKTIFPGKDLRKTIHPDEAVAQGAGLQAAILNGSVSENSRNFTKIQDITPMSIGVQIVGEKFCVIIPKGTKIPAKRSSLFITSNDMQTELEFPVYEGENPFTKDNNLLGHFELQGIPPRPEGEEQAEVEMHVSSQGILHVTARSMSTGRTSNLVVKEFKRRLDEATIQKYNKKIKGLPGSKKEEHKSHNCSIS